MKLGAVIVVILIFAIVASVISRIRQLNEQSRKIEKQLDYSKMKKWEDEDD